MKLVQLKYLPNQLIITRFLLAFGVIICLLIIPVFPDFYYYCHVTSSYVSFMNLIALGLFLVAAFTDWLDGYIARRYNLISTLGIIFDPLADKYLVNSILIIFAAQFRIPIWLVVLFIGRDTIIGGVRIYYASKDISFAANKWGKLKTFLQFFGLAILFVWFPQPLNYTFDYASLNSLFVIPLYVALCAAWLSGLIYVKQGFKKLKENEGQTNQK